MAEAVTDLLPTPAASQGGYNQSDSPGAAVRPQLPMLVRSLLPTPTASDAKNRRTSERSKATWSSGPSLADVLADVLVGPPPSRGDATPPPSTDTNPSTARLPGL